MDAEAVPLALAFVAGVASFVSPCHLAVVPAYLSVLGGGVRQDLGRGVLLRRAVLFIVGFSMVMVVLGMSVGLVGYLVWDSVPLLRKFGGVVLLILGFQALGLLRLSFLFRELRWRPGMSRLPADAAAFATGLVFGIGWTPCIGPVLAAILLLAAQAATVYAGGLLLAVYSLGLSLPFLLAALFLDRSPGVLLRMRKSGPLVEMATGVLLVAMGVLVYTNQLQRLASLIGNWSPV